MVHNETNEQFTPREKCIAKVFASVLHVTEESISLEDNFLLIGGNSILAMKAAAEIWNELHLESAMPAAVLLHYPTIRALEMFIDNPETTVSVEYIKSSIASIEKRVSSLCVAKHHSLEHCYPIFLTGATGFFGRFLLNSLLSLCDTVKIYCLVRQSGSSRFSRVQELLSCLPENASKRVRIVYGDISRPHFGMTEEEFCQIKLISFSNVIHCAGKVDWHSSYDSLFSDNVAATATMIEFAAQVSLLRSTVLIL